MVKNIIILLLFVYMVGKRNLESERLKHLQSNSRHNDRDGEFSEKVWHRRIIKKMV